MNSPATNEPHQGASREGASRARDLASRGGSERRKYRRVSLSWIVYLKCDGFDRPLLTTTRDISSEGFYCFLNRPIRPGEQVECDIIVPTHGSPDPNDVVSLRCRARAVRVEQVQAGGGFGMGCRIEEYHLVRTDSRHVLAAGRTPAKTAACS